MRRIIVATAISTLPIMSGFASSAQETQITDVTSPLATLYECSKLMDNTARLTCYDSHVADLQVKEEKKEIVAIDAEAAKKIKREAFGFSLPSLPKLGLSKMSGSNVESITLNVAKVIKRGHDYYFTMQNGQVWRQISGGFDYIPKGDIQASIKSKTLGSFKMS